MSGKHVRWADGLTGEQDNAPVVPALYRPPAIPLTNTDDSDSCSSPALSTPSSITVYPTRPLANVYPFVNTHSSAHTPKALANTALPPAYGRESPELFSASLPSPDRIRSDALSSPYSPHRTNSSTAAPHAMAPISLGIFLAYSKQPKGQELIWDIREDPSPSTVRLRNGPTRTNLSAEILLAPATNPPVREIRIHCVPHRIYEPMVVAGNPKSASPNAASRSRRNSISSTDYVTVLHVLRAIYHYLQKDVSAHEFARASTSSTFKSAVEEALHRRTRTGEAPAQQHGVSRATSYSHGTSRPHQDQNRAAFPRLPPGAVISASTGSNNYLNLAGLKRLDYLLGQTRFLGLERVEGSQGEWFIRVGPPL